MNFQTRSEVCPKKESGMTEYEKAEAGLLYDAHFDPQVDQGRRRSQELNFEYNALSVIYLEKRQQFFKKLLLF